jgi:hypothetical protein
MISTTLIERAFVAGAAWLALCLPAAAMDGGKKEGMKGAVTVSAGTLAENPAQYLGKKVTVKAEVENVVGPQVFTLDEDKLAAGPDVRVLMPRTARQMIRDDARVTVTGTVRPFVLTELERDYDWFDPTPGLEIEVKGRPVIVADSVRDAAGAELMTEAGTQSGPAASANKPATQGSAQAGAQQAAKETVTMTGCLRRTSDADVLVLTDATGGKQHVAAQCDSGSGQD